MDHVEVGTWKAWCPSFWALSKVPGILVTRKCTILGVGFLRVFIAFYSTLWLFVAFLFVSKHGAPKDQVSKVYVHLAHGSWI